MEFDFAAYHYKISCYSNLSKHLFDSACSNWGGKVTDEQKVEDLEYSDDEKEANKNRDNSINGDDDSEYDHDKGDGSQAKFERRMARFGMRCRSRAGHAARLCCEGFLRRRCISILVSAKTCSG